MKRFRKKGSNEGRQRGGKALLLALSAFVLSLASQVGRAVPCAASSFGPLRPIATGLQGMRAVLHGDFDENGKEDLVLWTQAGIDFLLPGAGGGVFLAPREIPVRDGGMIVATGDFNGDGHLDLEVWRKVSADGSDAAFSILLGDGRGGFVEGEDFPVKGAFLGAGLPGDFDGDGKIDLVASGVDPSNASQRLLFFLEGDGRGGFSVGAWTPLGLRPDSLLAADFNGDGKLDVVVSESGWHCGSVTVLLGDGHGKFPTVFSRELGPMFLVGDLNGDGRPDLVVGCPWATIVAQVKLNTGSGFLSAGEFDGPVHGNFGGIPEFIADFNGDGRQDVLAQAGGMTVVLLGDGKGNLGLPVDASRLNEMSVLDLDADGLPDLVLADSSGRLYVSLNNCQNIGNVETRFVVPYLLDAPGAANSDFRSEMTFVNRGKTTAFLESRFSTVLAGPSGSATTTLSAGTEWRSASLPEELGFRDDFGYPWGGMFRLKFSGLTSAGDIGVMARIRSTTNGTDFGGVAFPAVPLSETLIGPSWIGWLRETAGDRTNLAVLNPGDDADGETVLRVTLTSTDSAHPGSTVLPDFTLLPGGLVQVNRVLSTSGLGASSGYATVERIGGMAPYWTYAVVNDEANADGSIVAPLRSGARAGQSRLVLPVLVESGPFTSELVVTNASAVTKHLRFEWAAEAVDTADQTARFQADLAPGEQLYAPSFVQWLRDRNVMGVGSPGSGFAGALFVTVNGGDADGLFVGARTSAPGKIGRYGVFYLALAPPELAAGPVWLYALRQDAGNRTNVALVNAGDSGTGADTFRIEIFDGTTGVLAATVDDVRVGARGWKQLGSILAEAVPGVQDAYARITRLSGTAPFLAYAVVNDGAGPGLGTGDGSFVPMAIEAP